MPEITRAARTVHGSPEWHRDSGDTGGCVAEHSPGGADPGELGDEKLQLG